MRFHVAKGYFETYKSYDHMQQKSDPYLKKITDILRIKNCKIARFCCTSTYENHRNFLNFLHTRVIFWIKSTFYVHENLI